MNRRQLLQDIMNATIAMRDDVRLRAYTDCSLWIADLFKLGPIEFRQPYNGVIGFREYPALEAPLLGYWRYKLGLRIYDLTFGWRRGIAEADGWDTVCTLKGKYSDFEPLYFGAFILDAGVAIATWRRAQSNFLNNA